MPKDHARKNSLTRIKDRYGVKHADAIALLESDDCEHLCELLATYSDVNTYREAVAALDALRNDPRNQLLCDVCGWTNGMVCPECEKGCGCETYCTGWRHHEYTEPDYDDDHDPNACPECGAGGGSNPYGDCVCYDYDDEDQEQEAIPA